jgi:metallophosphoesterase (TIGR03767 family)
MGLGIPWYSMYGNHDGLVGGNVQADPLFESLATGTISPHPLFGPKIIGFPETDLYGWDEAGAARFINDLFTGQLDPAVLGLAPSLFVPKEATRRFVGPHEYVRAHWQWTTGAPHGHGFSEDNLGDGSTQAEKDRNTTLYYTFRPVEGVPLLGIALDTTNRLGGASGSIGARQLAWLEEQLVAVHSRWYDAGGRLQRGRADDHLVVLFAHHNLPTMDNGLPSPDDPQRVLGPQLRSLLHRFPNVIAFVNGHSHINRVWSRHDTSGRTQGFWEISTSAQLDYPMQTRVIEIVDNRDQTLSIFCSLIDGAGHADPRDVPGDGYDLLDLAGYGRELAYNDYRDHLERNPFAHRVGTAEDRNVELLLAAPFPLQTPGVPERVEQRVGAGRP